MKKQLILILLLTIFFNCQAQFKKHLYFDASFQAYKNNSLNFGVSYRKELKFPKAKFKHFVWNSLYLEKYIAPTQTKNIYAYGASYCWGVKNVYLGSHFRHVIQQNNHRLDISPLIRFGYKFIWLELSRNFLAEDNFFSNNTEPIKLSKAENNVKLIVTFPFAKK